MEPSSLTTPQNQQHSKGGKVETERLTLKECSNLVNVSTKTIRKHLKSGSIPYTIGKNRNNQDTFYILKTDILEWKGGNSGKVERVEPSNQKEYLKQNQSDINGGKVEPSILERLISSLESQVKTLTNQLEIKDKQINGFNEIISALTHQNQVLTMITQGIEPTSLIKNTPPQPPQPEQPVYDVEPTQPTRTSPKPSNKNYECVDVIQRLKNEGMSIPDIHSYLIKNNIPTIMGGGKWHRKTLWRLYHSKR